MWTGRRTREGGLALAEDNEVQFHAGVSSLLFHAESKWLFCGLLDAQIRAFRQDPPAEATLAGHGEAVTSMLVHESVLLSGSHDGSIRAWRCDASGTCFVCVTTIPSPLGQVFKLHLQPGALWVGAQRGISCLDLQTMQPRGNVESIARVVGLLPYRDCVIAAFANGIIKVFDAAGNEQFSHGPLGEHTTNTAVALMHIQRAQKDVLLCGQELGYVTVYDLPEFRPRGSFTTGYDGDVMAIVDMVVDVVLGESSGKLLRFFEGSLTGKLVVGMHVVEFVVDETVNVFYSVVVGDIDVFPTGTQFIRFYLAHVVLVKAKRQAQRLHIINRSNLF